MNPGPASPPAPRVKRPPQVHVLAALWAIKGAQELLSGVVGGGFYAAAQVSAGTLRGYALQLALQSLLFSTAMTAASFYVMIALWLGKRSGRTWGVAVALVNEVAVLAYLVSRPSEFGGDSPLVRTVVIATIVNLGIAGVLLFDATLNRFLGSARLVGWWAPKR